MRKLLFLIAVLFPVLSYGSNNIPFNFKLKPYVSYSFISTGSKSYFLQRYSINLMNKRYNKLRTNVKLSYLQINKASFIAPELNMSYDLSKNTKIFLNIKVMKPTNDDSVLFFPYKSFDDIGRWK